MQSPDRTGCSIRTRDTIFYEQLIIKRADVTNKRFPRGFNLCRRRVAADCADEYDSHSCPDTVLDELILIITSACYS